MNEIKYHLIVLITPEQKWRLKELAARRKKTVRELVRETILELLKEG